MIDKLDEKRMMLFYMKMPEKKFPRAFGAVRDFD
jgi:hypothetical protein